MQYQHPQQTMSPAPMQYQQPQHMISYAPMKQAVPQQHYQQPTLMSRKAQIKTTEIILLEERSNFCRITNIREQSPYYSYVERKTYRRENSKRDLKLFPTTSTPKHILRVITRGRSRPSKEAELGSQISGYNFAMDFKVSTYNKPSCVLNIPWNNLLWKLESQKQGRNVTYKRNA